MKSHLQVTKIMRLSVTSMQFKARDRLFWYLARITGVSIPMWTRLCLYFLLTVRAHYTSGTNKHSIGQQGLEKVLSASLLCPPLYFTLYRRRNELLATARFIPRDKINCLVRFGNCFLRVALMYQPSCLLTCCQGKPGKLAKNCHPNLRNSSFCLLVECFEWP